MAFLVAFLLGLSNGQRAAAKGHNRWVWTVLSAVAFVMFQSAAAAVLLFVVHPEVLTDPASMMQVMRDFDENLHWTRSLLLVAIGFGGYLLIRYIIERMPANTLRGGGRNPDDPAN